MEENIRAKAMLCSNYNSDFTMKYDVSDRITVYNSVSFNVKSFIVGNPFCKYGMGISY